MNAFVYEDKVYKKVPVVAIVKTSQEDFYILKPEFDIFKGLYKFWGVPVSSAHYDYDMWRKVSKVLEQKDPSLKSDRPLFYSYPRNFLVSGNFVIEYLNNHSIFIEVLPTFIESFDE